MYCIAVAVPARIASLRNGHLVGRSLTWKINERLVLPSIYFRDVCGLPWQ